MDINCECYAVKLQRFSPRQLAGRLTGENLTNLVFHDILNFNMSNAGLQPKFIKPFSRGQITLPKDYRDCLGIDETTWLRIFLSDDRIVVEPVKEVVDMDDSDKLVIKPKISSSAYRNAVLSAKGVFGVKIEEEASQVRKEISQRLKKQEF